MNIGRIAPDKITSLRKNEVFVFGSNERGIHGAGAARQALNWGAEFGVGFGLRGKTFAIPTKTPYFVTLSLGKISTYIEQFANFAKENPSMKFLVTEIGCGLAGYKPKDIAPLFFKHNTHKYENIYLPERFWNEMIK